MAGTFDDIPVSRPPAPSSAPPPRTGGGTFDDIPITKPPTWGEWTRDLFTGERRTEFPQAQEFSAVAGVGRGGISPEMAQAAPRGRDPKTFLDHVRRALGSQEFDAPAPRPSDVQVPDPSAISRAGITPDPKAQLDILKRNIPDLESQPDRFGNIMLRSRSLGVNEWTYLNRPGMSGRDWDEFGTQTLATLPFGAVVGLGRSLATRAAIGGAAMGSSSLAQDAAATAMGSEQGFDPTRAAISTGIGTVAGPLAGWLAGRAAAPPTRLAVQRVEDIAEDAAAHGRLDVRPFGPGFSQGPVASVARQLAETPIIGTPVRRALEESVSDTSRAAENIAGRFGTAATADEAGLVAREGLERFRDARPADVVERVVQGYTPAQRAAIIAAPVRDTSLKTKQAALYEQAWSRIPEEMQQGRAVADLPRIMQRPANTAAVIEEITGRNARMTVQSGPGAVPEAALRPVTSGLLGRMIEAVSNPRWTASLQTLRDMRSEFRRLASGMADTERNVLRLSDIERVQGALTQDMIALLERNVGRYADAGQTAVAANLRRAITEFRRADQFTRGATRRMEDIERLFNADNATALYRGIAQASLGGTRGDVNKLRVLTRTLRREEMNEVASYVLRAMGEPVASARGFVQEIGFSPSSFMTRLNNMQPEARSIIFGRQHAQALNDLGRVVNRLANVEALINTSRSGTNAINMGLVLGGGGAVWAGFDAFMTGLVGAGGAATASVLFSRPAYVRWVQGYAQLRAAAAQAPQRFGPALTAQVGRLEAMAASDPALLPIVRSLRMREPISEEERNGPDRREPAPQP